MDSTDVTRKLQLVMNQPVEIPLDVFVKQVACDAARIVIDEHVKACLVQQVKHDLDETNKEVKALAGKIATMIGIAIGAGGAGGGVAAGIIKAFGG